MIAIDIELTKRVEEKRAKVQELKAQVEAVKKLQSEEEALQAEMLELTELLNSLTASSSVIEVPTVIPTETVVTDINPVTTDETKVGEVPIETSTGSTEPLVNSGNNIESDLESAPEPDLEPMTASATPEFQEAEDYNWDALHAEIPIDFPLHKTVLRVLGQFKSSEYENLILTDNAPTTCVPYSDFMKYLSNSGYDYPYGYTRLHSDIVAEILGEDKYKVHKLINTGVIKGVKLNNTYSVQSSDLRKFILANVKVKTPHDYLQFMKVIPHLYPRAIYVALANNYRFTQLEQSCMFGFNFITKEDDLAYYGLSNKKWDTAHEVLSKFDPYLKEYYGYHSKGYYFGTSYVRDFFKRFFPKLLSSVITKNEKYNAAGYPGVAFIEFLMEYTKLPLTKVGGSIFSEGEFNPETTLITIADYYTPTELSHYVGATAKEVNEALHAIGYQYGVKLSPKNPYDAPLIQWEPTKDVSALVDPKDIARLKIPGHCHFSLHWTIDVVNPIRKYLYSKNS